MHRTFPASTPQDLYVELHAGELSVSAGATDEVSVGVEGPGADDVVVERDGDKLRVVAPRESGFVVRSRLTVHLRVPAGSNLVTKLASAGVTGTGELGSVRISTGSGSVDLEHVTDSASVRTGSGGISVETLRGEGHLKTGSGEIRVGRMDGNAQLTTGSGSISVGRSSAPIVLKSGSGDLSVTEAESDATLSTASGSLTVGHLHRGHARLKNVSGDISLGVPHGTPVWTDLSTLTGRVISTLTPVGAPAEGQDHIEVQAKTLSGDIHLQQV